MTSLLDALPKLRPINRGYWACVVPLAEGACHINDGPNFRKGLILALTGHTGRVPSMLPSTLTKLCRSGQCAVSGWISQMTKSQLIEKIAGETEVAKKQVKGVLETLATVGYKELKKSGVFLVPGFAKFVVVKKPATKARKGVNPFNGEPMMFKAKPARKIVRARPVKAAKDAV